MLTALACLWDLGFGLDDYKIVSILKMCKKKKPKHIQVKSSASSVLVARNQMFRSRRMWRQMQPSAARCGLGPSERMLQSLSDVNIFSSVLTAVIKKTTTLIGSKWTVTSHRVKSSKNMSGLFSVITTNTNTPISWTFTLHNDPTHAECFPALLTAAGHFLSAARGKEKVHTHPDLPKLAVPQTFDELQRLSRDLPHVFGFDGQVGQTRHAFVARHDQAAAQPRSPGWNHHT